MRVGQRRAPGCRWYVGGLLKHAPSLLAFTNPTVNSYHRLVPGFEAPVNLVPDPSANPYLAFSAMLMAGIDGIKNKIEPPEPVDKDLYELDIDLCLQDQFEVTAHGIKPSPRVEVAVTRFPRDCVRNVVTAD